MFKKTKNIIIGLTAFLVLVPFVSAGYSPIQVYATDAVAGYPSALRTSIISPNQDVRFIVEKPDKTIVNVPAQADLGGEAKTDLYGHQTKIAGKYKVSVMYSGSSVSSPQATFTVYPDKVSTTQSGIYSTLQMAEATKDTVFIVVTLYDQYNNPIPNHRVKIISSRSEDTIQAAQDDLSDTNGQVTFKVTSDYTGISVFTALDVTVNQLLDDREEVIFYAPVTKKANPFSASIFSADIGGDSTTTAGPVSYFDITGLSTTAKVNEQLTMTVTARDKDKNVVKNYTGTILISAPDDDNATLPGSGEYTFKAADLGQFTFSLSLQFSKTGKQTIQVLDKSNFKITGEKTIQINAKDSTSATTTATSSKLIIKSPSSGSKLGSSLVILTGKGDANINLKVFDNNTQIGKTDTDSDGLFSYQAKSLQSGSHTFYVMSDKGDISSSVSITIDTVAPLLNSFSMDTSGSVKPGSKVTITVQSEKDLDTATVSVQSIETDMDESTSEPGTYSATVTAPSKDGSYSVDVTLVDALSNKASFLQKGTIKVETPKPKNPPKVEGLTGIAGDSSVKLSWTAVTTHDQTIQNYRIYYGTKTDKLDTKADTKDSTATWELKGLTNNTQYFIAIKAVDSKSLESSEYSTTIAITPVAASLCANVSCGTNGACDSATGQCKCNTGWSGATCSIASSSSQIQATAYDSAVLLSWQPLSGVQAYYYKIFIGLSSGNYNDYYITSNNSTTAQIQDLINGVNYFFAVAALDINGTQISTPSQEVQAMPSGISFKSAASSSSAYTQSYTQSDIYNQTAYQYQTTKKTAQTGPETFWIVLSSFALAVLFYVSKRKLVKC